VTLVAGVDSSTQSTKVEVRRLDSGEIVGRASAAHPSTTPPRSEQDPAAWWSAFERAWAQVGAPKVAAISVAAQQHGMVTLDAQRNVLRPAKLWNDTQSAPDADWLLTQRDAQSWAAVVGSVPRAAFTITKLSWLHRTEPDTWARLAHVLLPHDWITLQMTGELVTDRGDASGTGYWSPKANAYEWSALAVVDRERDWTSVVPRVADPRETVGRWGTAAVACGTGDNMSAALGLGLSVGTAVVSLGTSGTVFTVAERSTHDATGAVAGFADGNGRFLPLVCTLNATKVTDTVQRLLGATRDEFTELVLSAPLGAGGLTMLPYLDGERTPDLPSAHGVLAGMRTDSSRQAFARAAVEGVVCGLLDGLDALRAQAPVDSVVLVGGGARSAAYRQVLAELCDVPVSTADADEAVATGAAVQAAMIVGGGTAEEIAARWGLLERAPVEVPTHDAAPELRARYARLRQLQYPSS
jgi:xylulokinase